MNNKFYLIVAILFALTIFPFCFSATNVAVTSPNGGETWSGTNSITWDFDDDSSSQNVDFNLFYSADSGLQQFSIINNLPFETYCDTTSGVGWETSTIDYTNGITNPSLSAFGTNYWEYGGVSYLTTGGFIPATINFDVNTYSWNNSLNIWEITSIDFTGLVKEKIIEQGNEQIEIFEYENEIYAFFTDTDLDKQVHGFKFDGANFIRNYDLNQGFVNPPFSNDAPPNMATFTIGDNLYSLFTGEVSKGRGYLFNGTNWILYSPIVTFDGVSKQGLQIHTGDYTLSLDTFVYNGNTYLSDAMHTADDGNFYLWTGSGWETNISIGNNFGYAIDQRRKFFNHGGNLISLYGATVEFNPASGNESLTWLSDSLSETSYQTQNSSSCSYSWDTTTAQNGTWFVDINGLGSTSDSDSSDANFKIMNLNSGDVTFTPISNVGSFSLGNGAVNITPVYPNQNVVFSIENLVFETFDFEVRILNGASTSKQYWIHTSTDGTAYALNETYTFGSGTNDGVQKLWNLASQTYRHDLSVNLTPSEKEYFEFRFDEPAKYWGTITNSFDWLKYSTPDLVSESGGKHFRDLYSSSFETPLLLVTKDEFPDLTSIDLTEGFYLQFNAEASESFDLEVGYRIGSTDTTVTVPITTTRTRYSVLIDPSDNNGQLVITTNDNDPVNIYLSDYSIIPTAYFIGNIELRKDGGDPLDTIVRGGVSNRYVREVLPTEFTTRFYDRERDLSKIIIQVILDGNIIKTYEDTIDYEAMITPQDILVYSRDLSGIVDYSGKSLNPNGTGIDLKDVVFKAILVNSSDQNVSEQFVSVKFLQYPYFQNDFEFYTSAINKKVGDNPKFALNFVQSVPEALIGFEIRIYSDDFNVFAPEYSTTIYTGDLGCPSLIVCSRTITIDEFAYSKADNWFITVAPILTTEEQDFTNSLTYKTEPVKVTYTSFETARLLQVFERTDLTYINSEQIPLVLQVRNDKLENLKNLFTTYLQVDLNDAGSFTTLDINFSPDKFVYDEKTGYNYWFWNTYFYDLSGNLVPDGNALRFKAVILPLTGKKQEGVFDAYGLVNKCAVYPSSFFEGTFLMNWGDAVDSVFGCDTLSSKVVTWDDLNAVHVLITNAHSVKATQNHSVWCVRTDTTYEFKQDVGDEFLCGVLYRKSEQMIDGFKISLTNTNSDFSLTGSEKQFIEFDVDQETIMFNDMLMLETALRSNFSTDKIDTLGEVMALGMNEILPFGQGIIDTAQLLAGEGVLIQNAGADINLSGALDPTKVSGMFFFKVKGLSVINVYDYSDYFEDADLVNPKYFLREANNKMIPIQINQAKITLYSSDFEPFRTLKLDSPLVVKKVANQTVTSGDTNYEFIPTALKFSFIVDMFSNNEQAGARAYVPIVFTYAVNNFITLGGILEGIAKAFSDPVSWFSENWFWLVMLGIFVIIISLVYANFNNNGGSSVINVNNKGS